MKKRVLDTNHLPDWNTHVFFTCSMAIIFGLIAMISKPVVGFKGFLFFMAFYTAVNIIIYFLGLLVNSVSTIPEEKEESNGGDKEPSEEEIPR